MHVPARDRVLRFIAATITTIFCGLLLALLLSTPGHTEKIRGWFFIDDYVIDVRWNEAVEHNGYLYVGGGKLADNNATNIMRYAKIRSDGGLQRWDNAPALPGVRYLHAMVADDDYLYLLGGWNPTTNQAYRDAWRAPFLSDGRLGTWEELRNLPLPVYIHDAVIANGYIYILGGFGGNSGQETLKDVHYAKITPEGLGVWDDGPDLLRELRGHTATYHNGRIYVTGGFDSDENSQSAVYMSTVQPDGRLSNWSKIAELRKPTHYHQAVIHNDQLVIMGGTIRDDPAPHYPDVYTATIDEDDGMLGDWVTKPGFDPGMSRFAAVKSVRDNSEFIYTIGGETSDGVLRRVFLSAPLGVVPTPTTPPDLNLSLSNNPKGWPAPGAEITYTIELRNPGSAPITNVELNGWIPENTELVEDSIDAGGSDAVTFSGFQPGDQITWSFGDLGPNESDSVSYRVLRPLRPKSSSALVTVSKYGPESVAPGEPITYTLVITSTLAQDINNLVVKDRLPRRATYVSGGALGDDGYVTWEIDTLPAFNTTSVEFVVTATQSLINSDYRVIFENFPDAIGSDIVITWVGNTPLPPEGDGTVITNTGAEATWSYAGQQQSTTSNPISNPSFSIYLPTVNR